MSFATTTATPGLSTKYAPGKPPYSFDDMAGDAVRVLDGYGIDAGCMSSPCRSAA